MGSKILVLFLCSDVLLQICGLRRFLLVSGGEVVLGASLGPLGLVLWRGPIWYARVIVGIFLR